MAKIIKFDYEGSIISFEFEDGNKMINATQMAKPFGKLVGNFLKSQHAKDYILLLESQYELWVYDRIEELLKTGKTEIKHSPSQNIIKTIRLIADQLEAHEKDITILKDDVSYIKEHIGDLEAKIISIDENYYSVSGYCALNRIDCPLKKAQQWGIIATKLSQSLNRLVGQAYDSKYGNVNTYHIDILKQVIK